MGEDDTVTIDLNADGITFSNDENGNVKVHLTYFRLPENVRRVNLTLTMAKGDLEGFAQSLLQRAREAPGSKSRH